MGQFAILLKKPIKAKERSANPTTANIGRSHKGTGQLLCPPLPWVVPFPVRAPSNSPIESTKQIISSHVVPDIRCVVFSGDYGNMAACRKTKQRKSQPKRKLNICVSVSNRIPLVGAFDGVVRPRLKLGSALAALVKPFGGLELEIKRDKKPANLK